MTAHSRGRRRHTRGRIDLRSAVMVVAIALAAFGWTACHTALAGPSETEQLDRARAATTRYQRAANAIADGYVDAHIMVEGMGVHYLNTARINAAFDPERPAILVYMPEADSLRLVALEYAVPIDSSAAAPSGFVGDNDLWDQNTTSGLWTLHAWVWYDNPSGVFAPTNPRLHLPVIYAAGGDRLSKGSEFAR